VGGGSSTEVVVEAGGVCVPGFPVLGGSISMATGLREEGSGWEASIGDARRCVGG
jgi:hypothetical protein